MTTREKVTALVTSFNEADQIAACLETLQWADEILLIDSFSTDDTVAIVRNRFPSVRIEQRRYLGAAAQKNWGVDRASHDWILVIDSDERVSAPLAREIERTLASPSAWAFSIGRINFVLGRRVRFSGLQRDRVTRLYHRHHGRYPNRRVHADLLVDGPTVRLSHPLTHFYVRSFEHMRGKMTRYGEWGATQLFINGERSGFSRMFFHPLSRFFRDWIGNFGFLDGAAGLAVVGMHVYYTFWKYLRLWEFTVLERQGRPVPLAEVDDSEETWRKEWEVKT